MGRRCWLLFLDYFKLLVGKGVPILEALTDFRSGVLSEDGRGEILALLLNNWASKKWSGTIKQEVFLVSCRILPSSVKILGELALHIDASKLDNVIL